MKIRNFIHRHLVSPAIALHKDRRGEGYLDSVVKIVIILVLGMLLLAFLYALFNKTLFPQITTYISNLFNYSGT